MVLRRLHRSAVVAAVLGLLASVVLAAAPDPDGIRDDCTDRMIAIADSSQAVIEQIEIQTDAALTALSGTSAPASRYYRIMLGGVEQIEKEQNKGIAKINKEADKCIARLQHLGAAQNSIDFVGTTRTGTRAQVGDAGFLALDGMNDTLTNLLFGF